MEDIDVIRQTLSSYAPGSTQKLEGHEFSRVCLQLFGLPGDGKSSLINSCLCVVHNLPFSNEAGAGSSSEPLTTARKKYKLTDAVCIADNRGLNRMTKDERLELSAQLRNLRAESNVNWEFEVERTVNQLENTGLLSVDFMVPVLVYSCDRTFDKNVVNELNPLVRDAFEISGIFPIVVLTKSKTENPPEARPIMEDLGCHQVLILDNYTTSNAARNVDTDSKVLKFLLVCLQEADRGIQKRQSRNIHSEFVKQAADQMKAEMRRLKELHREELREKEEHIRRLNNRIQDLFPKCRGSEESFM